MQPFSFLHCADVHLGAPFRGLTKLSPELGAYLRDAPVAAFTRLVTAAVEHKVAGFIIAGDLFDAADRNLRAQIKLRDQLVRLHEAGISTFITAGNHDPMGGWLSSIRYPESVHFFGSEMSAIPLERDGETLAHVYGVSFNRPEVKDNLAAGFPVEPEGPFSIGVLHASVGDQSEHAPYAPCSLQDLKFRRFDYWALGHVHKRETLHGEKPVIHYPGNPQGLHINETGPRGGTLVKVTSSGSISLNPIWSDVVRWHRLRTSIEGMQSIDDLLGVFSQTASAIVGEASECLHILRWTLTGGGPLHSELHRPEAGQDLADTLRAEHASPAEPGTVWVEHLDLATRAERDMRSLREQPDLLGDLLRLAEEIRLSPPTPPDREIGTGRSFGLEPESGAAVRDALAELLEDRRVLAALGRDPWTIADWPRLIAAAERLAIKWLASGEE
jgi:hypothetical protein